MSSVVVINTTNSKLMHLIYLILPPKSTLYLMGLCHVWLITALAPASLIIDINLDQFHLVKVKYDGIQ